MQDKFVLLAAEHEQAHSQRDDRTQAADPDHAPGEARAVQHRGAEARDVPVQRVETDDLGKAQLHASHHQRIHLLRVIENGGKIVQRQRKHTPQMHHIPKEHCCRGQCKADAQREYKQCQQRLKRQKYGGVQLGSCYKHYNNV